MKIVIVTNIINHYMLPFVEELIKIGCDAWFVETEKLQTSLKSGGFKEYEERPYFVRAWRDAESRQLMQELAMNADVLLMGHGPKMLEWKRLRKNKLTFEMSERPLKKGLVNLLSPAILKKQLLYHTFFHKRPLNMLCFSAYTATDEYFLHAFKNKCYKFGYFPRIPDYDVDFVLDNKPKGKIRFIWCARFIKWKHPELAVLLAEFLVKKGCDFEINMIGNGVEFDKIAKLIERKSLQQHVHLLGNFPNDKVLKIMAQHHIFLFTSDQNEGWGVVLNEAMGQCCCPVAANKIGSVPYLLENDKNGKVFKSGSLSSLCESVKELLDNPVTIRTLAKNAYMTVSNDWNSRAAATRFYELCSAMLKGDDIEIQSGICSKAFPINE